ncbi:hypothetical protein [Paeniglutamicibacter sp. NPDC091659]|uniref:hypothetical protein n=1 Tax=Paeniglutamicibacter sp. NPDC091659 TaxID=3364389 RepID=UPI0038189B4F
MLQEDIRWMLKKGWLHSEEMLSGFDHVSITDAGEDVVHTLRSARSNMPNRARALRDNYLRWLYDCDHNGDTRLTYDAFRATPHGNYLDQEFSDQEIRRATSRLAEDDFIAGEKMATGSIANPRLTTAGFDVIERYGSLANIPASQQGNVTTHISLADSHGSNISVGSSNVTQSSNVSVEQLEQVQKFIGSAKDMVPHLGVSPDKQAVALESINDLALEVAAPTPDSSRMKDLINKVSDIVILGSAQGMVDAVMGMAEKAMTALGG